MLIMKTECKKEDIFKDQADAMDNSSKQLDENLTCDKIEILNNNIPEDTTWPIWTIDQEGFMILTESNEDNHKENLSSSGYVADSFDVHNESSSDLVCTNADSELHPVAFLPRVMHPSRSETVNAESIDCSNRNSSLSNITLNGVSRISEDSEKYSNHINDNHVNPDEEIIDDLMSSNTDQSKINEVNNDLREIAFPEVKFVQNETVDPVNRENFIRYASDYEEESSDVCIMDSPVKPNPLVIDLCSDNEDHSGFLEASKSSEVSTLKKCNQVAVKKLQCKKGKHNEKEKSGKQTKLNRKSKLKIGLSSPPLKINTALCEDNTPQNNFKKSALGQSRSIHDVSIVSLKEAKKARKRRKKKGKLTQQNCKKPKLANRLWSAAHLHNSALSSVTDTYEETYTKEVNTSTQIITVNENMNCSTLLDTEKNPSPISDECISGNAKSSPRLQKSSKLKNQNLKNKKATLLKGNKSRKNKMKKNNNNPKDSSLSPRNSVSNKVSNNTKQQVVSRKVNSSIQNIGDNENMNCSILLDTEDPGPKSDECSSGKAKSSPRPQKSSKLNNQTLTKKKAALLERRKLWKNKRKNRNNSKDTASSLRDSISNKIPNNTNQGQIQEHRIHNPILKNLTSGNLRPIVIDGSNVAVEHGKVSCTFSAKGIQLCIDYFLNRGHSQITAFVPQFRRDVNNPHPYPTTDPEILEHLAQNQLVVFTPSRYINGTLISSYDDRFIVELATINGGIMVSNDNYQDLMKEKEAYRKTIEERLLMFVFVGDIFMVPEDPLGRHGPSLQEFLCF